ncbi:MAG: hypothetical protein AAF639_46945 [Chloroflexota bacterium]
MTVSMHCSRMQLACIFVLLMLFSTACHQPQVAKLIIEGIDHHHESDCDASCPPTHDVDMAVSTAVAQGELAIAVAQTAEAVANTARQQAEAAVMAVETMEAAQRQMTETSAPTTPINPTAITPTSTPVPATATESVAEFEAMGAAIQYQTSEGVTQALYYPATMEVYPSIAEFESKWLDSGKLQETGTVQLALIDITDENATGDVEQQSKLFYADSLTNGVPVKWDSWSEYTLLEKIVNQTSNVEYLQTSPFKIIDAASFTTVPDITVRESLLNLEEDEFDDETLSMIHRMVIETTIDGESTSTLIIVIDDSGAGGDTHQHYCTTCPYEICCWVCSQLGYVPPFFCTQ